MDPLDDPEKEAEPFSSTASARRPFRLPIAMRRRWSMLTSICSSAMALERGIGFRDLIEVQFLAMARWLCGCAIWSTTSTLDQEGCLRFPSSEAVRFFTVTGRFAVPHARDSADGCKQCRRTVEMWPMSSWPSRWQVHLRGGRSDGCGHPGHDSGVVRVYGVQPYAVSLFSDQTYYSPCF
jgi:hypothetical protein